MTMKSCFYPLIGDKIFGWMGDMIDTLSVMTTLFGVCTSLGLGTRQLNSGFNNFNSDIAPDEIWIQVKKYTPPSMNPGPVGTGKAVETQ